MVIRKQEKHSPQYTTKHIYNSIQELGGTKAAKLIRESLMLQKKLEVRWESISCNFHETARNQILRRTSTKEVNIINLEKCEKIKGT